MKKVIFIAGTCYSGSTLLDMTLGNDPKGFSIGEVNALFEPYRPHHFYPECGCYNKKCQLWSKLKQGGLANLYTNIFKQYPNIEYIVDSSKEPLWINARIKALKKQGIAYEIVLIWKTPLEIANSFNKRDDYSHWAKAWVNYHRLLYTLQPQQWSAISYHDYVRNPASLKTLCQQLGIEYFAGKEKFWEKEHHIVFGNHSARKHLAVGHKDNRSIKAQKDFQKITYEVVDSIIVQARVAQEISDNPSILLIKNTLKYLTGGDADALQRLDQLRISTIGVLARKVKHHFRLLYAKTFAPINEKSITQIKYNTEH